MAKINKYTEIALNEINLEDTTFSFSFPQELDRLTESISKMGLFHPILLYHKRIACGRRRILSCKKLGWKEIPVGIIEGTHTEIEIFKLNLEDNLSIRELNIIEKSKILNKLLNLWQVPQENIIKEYLPLLKIPANIKYLNKYLWLNDLSEELTGMLIKGKVSLDTLNITRDWPENIRDKILNLALSFGFGTNKTGEILTLLSDISIKDNSPIDKPIQAKEWLKTNNNPQIPPYQKGLWLRKFLLMNRYPMHTEFRDRVKSLIAKLPENISIELNNLLSWEEDSISLKVKCKKKEDLEQTIKELSKLSNSPELSELLGLLRIPH